MPVDSPEMSYSAMPPTTPDVPAENVSVLGATSRLLLVTLAALTVALDQVTKAIVHSTLPLHDSIVVIPGFLDFTHTRNTGAAFGLLNAVDLPFKQAILTGVAVTALAAIGVYAARSASRERAALLGLTLVIGGAIGNLIDRVMMGYVLDFIDVYWRGWHFWVFNVADAAITVGAALLILDMLLVNRHVSETA